MKKFKKRSILAYAIDNYGFNKEVVQKVLGNKFLTYDWRITVTDNFGTVEIEGINLDENIIEEELKITENKLFTLWELKTNLELLKIL